MTVKKSIKRIYEEGVCIDKNEKAQINGNTNQRILLLFLIAKIKKSIDEIENIYECIYAKGVPETG